MRIAKSAMNIAEYRTLTIVYREQPLRIEYLFRGGHKGTVIYLHGLGSSKEDFARATNNQELQTHTLVAFDFPGCGNSPYPDGMPLFMDDLVKITNTVILKLNLNKFVLVGHSMGGLVALLYAEAYHGHAKGLINIEGNLASEDCFFSRKIANYGPTGFSREVLDELCRKILQSKSKGLREFARVLQNASEKACFDYSSSMVDYSDNANLLQRFDDLKIPKMFMYGSENRGLSYITKLKNSDCEVVEIPSSGHLPFYDNPQAYYKTVSNFLASVSMVSGEDI